ADSSASLRPAPTVRQPASENASAKCPARNPPAPVMRTAFAMTGCHYRRRSLTFHVVHKILRARSGFAPLNLRELWQYRDLIYFFTWRDILVRYKQTVIGVLWAVLRPFLTMVIFTFVFDRLAKVPSGNIPYPVFALGGLLPWQLFANAFSESAGSVVGNAQLVSKVYFPRLSMPVSSIVSS